MKTYSIAIQICIYIIIISYNSFCSSLYVWAQSGLNLREKPSIYSESVGIIQYGEKVHLIKRTMKTYKTQVTENVNRHNGLLISGNWLEVEYLGKKGFLISTWLSSFPSPQTFNIFEYFRENIEETVDTQKTNRTIKISYGDRVSISHRREKGVLLKKLY